VKIRDGLGDKKHSHTSALTLQIPALSHGSIHYSITDDGKSSIVMPTKSRQSHGVKE
jgi:hypothetical protein